MNIGLSDANYAEILSALTGVFMLLYGNGRRTQFSKLRKQGFRVEGEVIEIKSTGSRGADSGQTYYPVIRFETGSGPVAADYDLFISKPCAYDLWEKVAVVYDPEDHKKFVVDNLNSRFFVWFVILNGFLLISCNNSLFHS